MTSFFQKHPKSYFIIKTISDKKITIKLSAIQSFSYYISAAHCILSIKKGFRYKAIISLCEIPS